MAMGATVGALRRRGWTMAGGMFACSRAIISFPLPIIGSAVLALPPNGLLLQCPAGGPQGLFIALGLCPEAGPFAVRMSPGPSL